MARPKGFEPLASASGGQRSIQLSYGRMTILSAKDGVVYRPSKGRVYPRIRSLPIYLYNLVIF